MFRLMAAVEALEVGTETLAVEAGIMMEVITILAANLLTEIGLSEGNQTLERLSPLLRVKMSMLFLLRLS